MPMDKEVGLGNVIEFTPSNKKVSNKTSSSSTAEWVKSAVVHSLGARSHPSVIYWERDVWKHSYARDFFKVLADQKRVDILCDGDTIAKNSIVSVCHTDKSRYELSVQYFIRLTADRPDLVDDVDSYVMGYFNGQNIQVGMQVNDSSIDQTELSTEELFMYKPEEISAYISLDDSFYTCQLMRGGVEPIWYGEIDQFDCMEKKVTLLDVMVLCINNVEINNLSLDGASMEVSLFEGNNTFVTSIGSDILPRILFEAIKRVNPIYEHMSYSKALDKYFNTTVVSKLKPNNDMDEE